MGAPWPRRRGGAFSRLVAVPVIRSNIQLAMIPDKLIVFCRRLTVGTSYAGALWSITNVNINFNNNAGSLSSMTRHQLYKAPVASGLESLSWGELSGVTASVSDAVASSTNAEPASGFARVGACTTLTAGGTVNTPGFQLAPTVGSVVVLNFGEVSQLAEDFYMPGSLGSSACRSRRQS